MKAVKAYRDLYNESQQVLSVACIVMLQMCDRNVSCGTIIDSAVRECSQLVYM